MSDLRANASFKTAKHIIRFVLPIILLTVIFRRVDLGKLAGNFREVNFIYLIGVVVLAVFSQLLIGSLRWKIILKGLYGIGVPYLSLLKYMWIGLFVGYFVPGGVGIDIYRTYKVAKHGGGYDRNIAAIIGEKIYAAIASLLLLLVCYLIIRSRINAEPGIIRIIWVCFMAGSTAVLLGVAALITIGRGRGRALLSFVYRRLESAIIKIMSKISGRDRKSIEEKDYASTLIKPLFNWKIVLMAVSMTVIMRILTGIGINILYRALDVQLPVIVNIFVNTLLFYIFILPVSFGTLGVREGGNILLYGLFGVDVESALAASYLSLACVLLAISIGGIILLADNAASGKSKLDRGSS
ncbi:MAG: flippase-like domain-containing protein [Candidatus Krumholzibacteriota bacterium]|nr:flippase-like domain-containing protein [Candidatus Krumholzibacteriota bacterium]